MSKIGKKLIKIPQGVEVEIKGSSVTVTGNKGSLTKIFPSIVIIEKLDDKVKIGVKGKSKRASSMHGTARAIISNMVKGVTDGWSKSLELVGTGYRAEVSGNTLILTVGFSHPVKIEAPEEIFFKVEKADISVEGLDKEVVGEVAAKIRSVRPPEPYKGKGIKYKDEVVRRKPGKAAKAAGAAA